MKYLLCLFVIGIPNLVSAQSLKGDHRAEASPSSRRVQPRQVQRLSSRPQALAEQCLSIRAEVIRINVLSLTRQISKESQLKNDESWANAIERAHQLGLPGLLLGPPECVTTLLGRRL